MSDSPRNSRLFLVLGGVLLALLLAIVITLGSLRVPFRSTHMGRQDCSFRREHVYCPRRCWFLDSSSPEPLFACGWNGEPNNLGRASRPRWF